MVTDTISSLSTLGVVLLSVVALIALIASVTSGRWFPKLVWKAHARRQPDIERVAVPRIGFYYPLILFFVIFPVFALFADAPGAWWIFMLFGWGMAAVIMYYLAEIRKTTTGVMKAGGRWYITATPSWLDVSTIRNVYIGSDSNAMTPEYKVEGTGANGRRKVYGYLALSSFAEADRPFILEFIRYVKDRSETPDSVS